MDIDHLKEFVVLCDIGSYTEAADALFLSQSSLSKHIKSLEHELGAPLLERSARGVRPNPYGEALLPYARQISALHYRLSSALDELKRDRGRTLNIGSISIMASYRITNLILDYRAQEPTCTVNLIEGEPDQLKRLLKTGRCEIAFVREEHTEQDGSFTKIPYTEDTVVAVAPRYHPLARRERITFNDLRDQDLLLLQPGSALYNSVIERCGTCGFIPRISYTGQRAENIIDLVEKGMGISLLMKRPLASLENPKIKIIEIDPPISTGISMYYLRDTPLSDDARRFIELATARHGILREPFDLGTPDPRHPPRALKESGADNRRGPA